MNDLRAAAQQALEALELALAPFPLDFIRCQKAAEALRAALAEPVQELQRKPRHVSYVCPQCHWSLEEATTCPPCNGNCNQGRNCPARDNK